MDLKVNTLIPIRAKSRRIPRKNFRDFAGKPLHVWMISRLISCKHIDKIFIDTDSDEIENFYSDHELVEIIRRPQELSSEFTSVNDLITYDLSLAPGAHFLQTHVTNPLLKAATVDLAIEKYFKSIERGFDSLFSVTRVFERYWNANSQPVNHDPKVLIRTQDLPPFYVENSCIYLFSRNVIMTFNSRIGEKPVLFEIHPEEALDIDEMLDFEFTQFVFERKRDEYE